MALFNVLTELAERRPTLAVVDDAGWLDSASANALGFAARRIDGQRIGFVTTVRLPADDVDPLGLRRAFGDDNTTALSLGPLDGDALIVLIERQSGPASPSRCCAAATAAAIRCSPSRLLERSALTYRSKQECRCRSRQPAPPGGTAPSRHCLTLHELLCSPSALTHPSAAVVESVSSAEDWRPPRWLDSFARRAGHVRFGHPLYASAVYGGGVRPPPLAASPTRHPGGRRRGACAPSRPRGVRAGRRSCQRSGRCRCHRPLTQAWGTAGELLELARSLTPTGERHAASRRSVSAAEHHIHAGDRPRARAILEDILAAEPDRPTAAPAPARRDRIQPRELRHSQICPSAASTPTTPPHGLSFTSTSRARGQHPTSRRLPSTRSRA